MNTQPNELSSVGRLLREWRQRRRMSQLDCACEANISTKHLSFLETGRSRPSREMVLRLAELLDVPLRERNALLVAAGFAPCYAERALAHSALVNVRAAVDKVLKGHEPFPALAIDRHWTMLAANASIAPLLASVHALLLQPPVNVLRLSLHPQGLAPSIANLPEWRAHLLSRLRRQIHFSGDATLEELFSELKSYGPASEPVVEIDPASVVVPLKLRFGSHVLSFFSTTTVFGTPSDVTVSELALECFYPADEQTSVVLRSFA
jgi:transcriptional regulator with XRE-family HTH domain